MPSSPRTLLAATLVGASTLSVVVSGTAAQAASRTPAYLNLSVGAAAALLPAASRLPVRMKAQAKVQVSGLASAIPCLGALFAATSGAGSGLVDDRSAVLILDGIQASASYASTRYAPTSPDPVSWTIAATAFRNPAKAKASMAHIVKMEKACPKAVAPVPDGAPGVTRTLSAPYAVGAWSGYRSIDHMVAVSSQGASVDVRLNTVYLTRGNVLLSIEEDATSVPRSGPKQEAWRQAVVRLVVGRFNARR